MKKTELVFSAIKEFDDARRKSRETFLEKKRKMEFYKGTKAYEEDMENIRNERENANKVAREKAARILNEALDGMYSNIRSLKVQAPSDENIRLLQVVQMLDHPSRATYDSIANSLDGNMLALNALDVIARKQYEDKPDVLKYWRPNYAELAKEEMGAEAATRMVKTLEGSCQNIIRGSGAEEAKEKATMMHTKKFGGSYNPDDLKQSEPYTTERDFYRRTLALDERGYKLFATAVNGENA